MKIRVVNGPNLNALSRRDPKVYGTSGYDDIVKHVKEWAGLNEIEVDFFQSNHEGNLVDHIQNIPDTDAIVINPGALAHYSYALRDALEIFKGPKVEVHISNIFKREEFRTHTVTAPVCNGVISGFGEYGYILAIQFIVQNFHNRKTGSDLA